MKQHIHSEKSIKLLKHFFLRMNGKKRINPIVDETLFLSTLDRCKEPQSVSPRLGDDLFEEAKDERQGTKKKSKSPKRWAAWLRDNPSLPSIKKQIGLLFLNQGLESDDLMKMKSLLRGSGIYIKKIPLRLWSRSQNNLNREDAPVLTRSQNALQRKKMLVHGEALGFFRDEFGSALHRPDVAFVEASALYQHWINIIAFLAIHNHPHKGADQESKTNSVASHDIGEEQASGFSSGSDTTRRKCHIRARRYDWLHFESLAASNTFSGLEEQLLPQDVSSSFGSLFFAGSALRSPQVANENSLSGSSWDNVASGSANPETAPRTSAVKRDLAEKQNLVNVGVNAVISLIKKNNLHYIGSIATTKSAGLVPPRVPQTFHLENEQLFFDAASPMQVKGTCGSYTVGPKSLFTGTIVTFLFDFEFLSSSGPRMNSFVRL